MLSGGWVTGDHKVWLHRTTRVDMLSGGWVTGDHKVWLHRTTRVDMLSGGWVTGTIRSGSTVPPELTCCLVAG